MTVTEETITEDDLFHFCAAEPYVPEDLQGEAERLALEENPLNGGSLSANKYAVSRIAVASRRMWKNGRTLRVRFMGGSVYVQNKVKSYANLWSKYVNIRFRFVASGNTEIRIAFNKGGSWSMIGTDALTKRQNQETMNFGWFTNSTEEREFRRTTMHEFGHALGFIHEHQRPDAPIVWNKPAVYAAYKKPPNKWSPKTVDEQIFSKYAGGDLKKSKYDNKSIMQYDFPKKFTRNGFSAPVNYSLSPTDIRFARRWYPKIRKSSPKFITTNHAVQFGSGSPEPQMHNRSVIPHATQTDDPADVAEPPHVLLGLDSVDFPKDTPVRVKAIVEDVTTEGTHVNVHSWGEISSHWTASSSHLQLPPDDFDFQHGSLQNLNVWPGTISHHVKFNRPYASTPKVIVWLTAISADREANLRVRVYAENVTREGFEAHVDTWADSHLLYVKYDWLAYSELNGSHIVAWSVTHNSSSQWTEHDQEIRFADHNDNHANEVLDVPLDPHIFSAFSCLEIDKGTDARIKLDVKDLTVDGVTCLLQAGDHSLVNRVDANYLAIF